MPVFILLSTLTVQGVQTLKSNPERLRAVNQDVEELGCKVLHQWATLGEFDFINVVEAPDEATIARVSASAAFNLTLAHNTFGLSTAKRKVALKPSKRLIGKAKKFSLQVKVVAADRSGNRTVVTRTVKVK